MNLISLHKLKLEKVPLLAMLRFCIVLNVGIVLDTKGVTTELSLEDCLMLKRQSRLMLLMVDIFEL